MSFLNELKKISENASKANDAEVTYLYTYFANKLRDAASMGRNSFFLNELQVSFISYEVTSLDSIVIIRDSAIIDAFYSVVDKFKSEGIKSSISSYWDTSGVKKISEISFNW